MIFFFVKLSEFVFGKVLCMPVFNGFFEDFTEEAGIFSSKIGFGLGLGVSDLNSDGYPDIYVGNDFFENDYLYINQGNKTFKEL